MKQTDSSQVDAIKDQSISRREFFKVAGIAGAVVSMGGSLGGLLAACGEDAETTTASATSATASATSTVSTGAEVGREIKLGFVTPLTGGIASFGIPDQYCADRASEAIGDGIVSGDGKRHPVSILVRDSQSDTSRAAQVTGDLITLDNCDIIVTASTPDTVCPVADQAEALGTPCISNDCPWQPYVSGRSGGDIAATFKWTYHTFWGLEDAQANYLDMWTQVPNNEKVAVLFSNDADGNAWDVGWKNLWSAVGLTAVEPGLFQIGTEDFSSQIAEFKKEGCELGLGVWIPPDFANFWKQAYQQGWKPKIMTVAKALLFPQSMEALGDIGTGLTTEVWWMPTHPFASLLLGETCQQFADEFTRRTNTQWTQPLLHFIIFDLAIDVLKRTTNIDDKEAILAAIKGTKLDTIGGHIDFTAPVEPAGPPWATGPRHIHENVYKTPQVGGQWRKGTTYPYELTICSNAAAPEIAVQDTVQPLE